MPRDTFKELDRFPCPFCAKECILAEHNKGLGQSVFHEAPACSEYIKMDARAFVIVARAKGYN